MSALKTFIVFHLLSLSFICPVFAQNSKFVNHSPVARAIPFDNTTDGWLATDVQDAIEEAPIHLRSVQVSSTAGFTISSTGADVLLTTMTITATPGTYIAWFSSDITSANGGSAIACSFYNNGTQMTSSMRKIIPFSGGTLTSGNARAVMSFQDTPVITAGALEVRCSISSSTATANDRTLTMLRVL